MDNRFQHYLKGTIHDSTHLNTVFDRMEHLLMLREAIQQNNPSKAKAELTKFYQYIQHDHENYVAPDNLLAAAKGRTHFFHGLIYSQSLDSIGHSVFAYSLSLVHIEMINLMDDPNTAFDLTCSIIDTYSNFIQSNTKLNVELFSSKVMAYIDMHLTETLNTSKIAHTLNIHPDYLQKKFKSETGANITDIINIRRIELAKIYLRSSTYSITYIALEVGYSDVSYFGKVFRKYVAQTPSDFRSDSQH